MKTFMTMVFLVIVGFSAMAQDTTKAIANKGLVTDVKVRQEVTDKSAAYKTNTSWDIIANLYQIALDDITGTSKGLTFGATLHAISSGFNTTDAPQPSGYFANNFQPVITFNYINNFKNLNTSAGFKYAIINETDAAHSSKLNHNPQLQASTKTLNIYSLEFRKALLNSTSRKIAGSVDKKDSILAQYDRQLKEVTKFELGDTSALDPELAATFNSTVGPGKSLAEFASQIKVAREQITDAINEIKNGFNVNINPMLTYDLTHSGVQGFNFGVNGSKGFNLFNKAHSFQIIAKANYIIGTDTIVTTINTGRRQFTNQLGFNQVIVSRIIKSVSETEPTPSLEASLTGGYNYVYAGLNPNEKKAQPALNFKIALLVGKGTWLTVPVTYNFGTKSATSLISLKANLSGDALFK